MTSNAYIATDGEKLMKVGKANNPKRREKQINLPINITLACLDEATAFRVEDQLRQFIVERGGIKHASTLDWFAYDPQIYTMLCEFAGTIDGFEPIHIEEDEGELEIRAIRKRYFQLIEEERLEEAKSLKADKDSLERKVTFLEAERDRLRKELEAIRNHFHEESKQFYETLNAERRRFHKEIDEEREGKYTLIRESGQWAGMFKGIKKSLVDRGQKPIDSGVMLDFLNSLVPEDIE
jgi:hypothetical protein